MDNVNERILLTENISLIIIIIFKTKIRDEHMLFKSRKIFFDIWLLCKLKKINRSNQQYYV